MRYLPDLPAGQAALAAITPADAMAPVHRGASPGRVRQARVLTAVVAGMALLVTACGGGSPAASGATVYQTALAYSNCMRAQGEPGFPDPDSQGNIDQTLTDQDLFHGLQYQTASKACRKLLPPSPPESAAQQEKEYQKALKFAVCMRSHGFPDFPDPTPVPYVGFDRPKSIDVHSPQFQSARQTCHTRTGFGPSA
jgi:hypothetical protein